MLHPFIPFFTEKVWLDFKFGNYFKTPLMFKKWTLKPQNSFNKNHNKIDWLIKLVANIRSAKVDLDISPGAFIDVSINELKSSKRSIVKNNEGVFRRLGRVSNIYDSKINKNGIRIIAGGESIRLYFDHNVNLDEQRLKISKKVNDLDQKIIEIKVKMKNKSFLKNAPKQIVDKEKKALKDYKIELKKLNSILNSIKN